MVKFQRNDLKPRLRSNQVGYKQINYFKLNQGQDAGCDDSEYVEDFEMLNKSKKVKKNKTLRTKDPVYQFFICSLYDNFEVLLGWKRDIEVKQPDTSSAIVVKKLVSSDLSQYAKQVQGILINTHFRPELKQLELSRKVISNGIVFIWSDKGMIPDAITYFESKGFVYIENLVIVRLDLTKAYQEISKYSNIRQNEESVLENLKLLQLKTSVKDILAAKPYGVFNQSKDVLLMFRKFDENKTPLELRHQRTSDVLFDFDANQKSKEYVYNMIETLLPKAQLLEMYYLIQHSFADEARPRKNWISLCSSK